MTRILSLVLLASILVIESTSAADHTNPHFNGDRTVIVQMFEWKFNEIAKECEEFLGPKGYGGVQTSPVAAHAIITNPFRPWWERYQPVGYSINSRSGNEADFKNMVDRCNKANVRVYVDVLLNHMSGGQSGKGTDGSSYDGNSMNYPGVPFSAADFHGHDACPTQDLNIHDYDNPVEARNCRLSGLRDLNQGKEYVRQKQVDFLNKLIDIGVAGFRSDASKHQWPADMEAIIGRIHNLNTKYFAPGSKAFFAHEFIQGGTHMKSEEYFPVGRVMEFRFGSKLAEVLRKWNNQKLKYLKNFGEGWGLLPSGHTLAMIDNHDLQRGHSGDLGRNINFFEPKLLKIATAFMLSLPYGVTRVMSSYHWPRNVQNGHDINDGIGPPNHNGEIMAVTRNADNTCNKEWVCEHRWRQIANMVKFRNVAGNAPLTNWWDDGNNAIAFSRGNKAFFALSTENDHLIDHKFNTGLPAGQYCDIITSDFEGGKCKGRIFTVGSDGKLNVHLNKGDDQIIAIHVQAKI